MSFLQVTFFGVRGSTPCPCDRNQRYGGNTSCVAIDAPGIDPIVFDLGTGLRFFGETQPTDGTFAGHALVTHLHWDHVQGLPFFVPIHAPGARFDVYGPASEGMGLGEAFEQFMCPPYFPVRVRDLAGAVEFHTLDEGSHAIGGAKVEARLVPHLGPTFGYRVEIDGTSVVYIPDHQQPLDGSHDVDPAVIELCRDADVLIHDAQFTSEEFAAKAHWGHCTVDFAVEVAASAGVRRLVLFHHDPTHSDAMLDELAAQAGADACARGVDEVLAAHEGLTLVLAPPTEMAPLAEVASA